MKYHTKFLIGDKILNYLKYVCFGIGKRYFFGFHLIDSDGDVYSFVDSELRYSFKSDENYKISHSKKSLK
jgi:putative transposase